MTPHFTLKELTSTSTGLVNVPRELYKQHLKWIALKLEFIRSCYNRPIYIDSAFRSPDVNKAVGGSPTSLHLVGLAVDIRINNISYKELPKFLEYVLLTNPYEIHPNSESILHISWHPNKDDIFDSVINSDSNVKSMVSPSLRDKVFTDSVTDSVDNDFNSFNNLLSNI